MLNPPSEYLSYMWKLKHEQSIEDVKSLLKRPLYCPKCNFRNGTICEDASGHMIVVCRKCKFEINVDLAHFRKSKTNYKPVKTDFDLI